MPKRVKVFLVILALIWCAAFTATSAGKFSYLSGIQVQNLSPAVANVQLTYFKQDGTIDGISVDDTIPANGSRTYFPVDASVGFDGSVAISSDQPIAAISNILGDQGQAAASYIGSNVGSTTVSLPLLFQDNDGFDTWFNVQNTGSVSATVQVAYSDGTSAAPLTIAPGAAHTYDQTLEPHTKAVFSGVVTSEQPVAVAVIQESADVMLAYTGFTAGSPDPFMPLINIGGGAGIITGIQIQNTGNTATEVTVSYLAIIGTDCIETQVIPAHSSATFALYAFWDTKNGENCPDYSIFVGSAKVTTNSTGQDLVAIVNQLRPGVYGESYSGFDPNSATETAVMPLIMDRNGGYFTGFNVQNVGASTTTVLCTYTNSPHTDSATLDPGEAMNVLQLNALGDGYVGSATCTASDGGAIIGVVNELGPSSTADQLLVYEAINH